MPRTSALLHASDLFIVSFLVHKTKLRSGRVSVYKTSSLPHKCTSCVWMLVAIVLCRARFADRDARHSTRHSRLHLSAARVAAVLTVMRTPERRLPWISPTTIGQKCTPRVSSLPSRLVGRSRCDRRPVKKRRRIGIRGLARMFSCVVWKDKSETQNRSLASPRRLRNGTIDLVRFDRSEAETREVYVPRRLSADIAIPPAPLPISTSPVSCPVKEQDDLQFRTDIQRLKRMSGRWTLDASRSDSFATMCELLEFDKSLLEELNKSLIIDVCLTHVSHHPKE